MDAFRFEDDDDDLVQVAITIRANANADDSSSALDTSSDEDIVDDTDNNDNDDDDQAGPIEEEDHVCSKCEARLEVFPAQHALCGHVAGQCMQCYIAEATATKLKYVKCLHCSGFACVECSRSGAPSDTLDSPPSPVSCIRCHAGSSEMAVVDYAVSCGYKRSRKPNAKGCPEPAVVFPPYLTCACLPPACEDHQLKRSRQVFVCSAPDGAHTTLACRLCAGIYKFWCIECKTQTALVPCHTNELAKAVRAWGSSHPPSPPDRPPHLL